jgi:hypothetical protein
MGYGVNTDLLLSLEANDGIVIHNTETTAANTLRPPGMNTKQSMGTNNDQLINFRKLIL